MAKGNKTAKKAGKGSSKEILIVGSKMKDVVKAAGCMSSGDLIEALSAKVHEMLSSRDRARQGQRPFDRPPVRSVVAPRSRRTPRSLRRRGVSFLWRAIRSRSRRARRSAIEKREVLLDQLVERERAAAARALLRRRRASLATVEVALDVDEPLFVEAARRARVGRVERLDLCRSSRLVIRFAWWMNGIGHSMRCSRSPGVIERTKSIHFCTLSELMRRNSRSRSQTSPFRFASGVTSVSARNTP